MMLLYDRVYERAFHYLRRNGGGRLTPTERVIVDGLRRAVVYDISDVVPLFGDWAREREKAIPRRPPHPVVWAEWSAESPTFGSAGADVIRVGAVVRHVRDVSAFRRELAADAELIPPEYEDDIRSMLSDGDELYDCRVFRRWERVAAGPSPAPAVGELTSDVGSWFFALRDGGAGIRSFRFSPMMFADRVRDWDAWQVFDLPALTLTAGKGPRDPEARNALDGPEQMPWPPFMAFALLHCRNVVTVSHRPDGREQRRVAKAGNPPRTAYRTLRIEVPKAAAALAAAGDWGEDDEGPKVRFHLCSGHFKHLVSERYKAKRGQWVWCPAHWKGSKELGVVEKDYRVERRRAGAEGED
jgi:hypothetical protein